MNNLAAGEMASMAFVKTPMTSLAGWGVRGWLISAFDKTIRHLAMGLASSISITGMSSLIS
jgi:hypothetical protein